VETVLTGLIDLRLSLMETMVADSRPIRYPILACNSDF
jgi:hypothetical protein